MRNSEATEMVLQHSAEQTAAEWGQGKPPQGQGLVFYFISTGSDLTTSKSGVLMCGFPFFPLRDLSPQLFTIFFWNMNCLSYLQKKIPTKMKGSQTAINVSILQSLAEPLK